MSGPKLTRRQGAIVTLATGIVAGPWQDALDYAERLADGPVTSFMLAVDHYLERRVRKAAMADLIAIAASDDQPRDLGDDLDDDAEPARHYDGWYLTVEVVGVGIVFRAALDELFALATLGSPFDTLHLVGPPPDVQVPDQVVDQALRLIGRPELSVRVERLP